MGLILRKHDSYSYKDKFNKIEFLNNKPVFNLPPEVEKYLLGLGYFHYVADPGKEVPKEIQDAEDNASDKADTPEKKEQKYKDMRTQADDMKKAKNTPPKTLVLDEGGVHEETDEEKMGKTDIDFDGEGFDNAREAFEVLGVEGTEAVRLANNALNLSRILKCDMPEACNMIINKEQLAGNKPQEAKTEAKAELKVKAEPKEEKEPEIKMTRKPVPAKRKPKRKAGRK